MPTFILCNGECSNNMNLTTKKMNNNVVDSKSPKSAANRFFTKLAKNIKLNSSNNRFIVFTIKNISSGKEYKYIGTRVLLENPVVITTKNGKKITYKYSNIIGEYKPVLNSLNNSNKTNNKSNNKNVKK